jgi:hypothetical protein
MEAIPAAPKPLTTTRMFSNLLLTTFKALINPAKITTAVPC